MNVIDRIPDNSTVPSILAESLIFDSDDPAMTNEIPCAKNMETMYMIKFMLEPSFFNSNPNRIDVFETDICF